MKFNQNITLKKLNQPFFIKKNFSLIAFGMIMELSKSKKPKTTATIIASITIANVLDINFRNVAIQAETVGKLEDKDNGVDSINW